MSDTYYDVLGIGINATDKDIKSAYRTLARQYHPDANPNINPAVRKLVEDKFKDVQESYEVLKNSAKRTQYDKLLVGAQISTKPAVVQPYKSAPQTPVTYCTKCGSIKNGNIPTCRCYCQGNAWLALVPITILVLMWFWSSSSPTVLPSPPTVSIPCDSQSKVSSAGCVVQTNEPKQVAPWFPPGEPYLGMMKSVAEKHGINTFKTFPNTSYKEKISSFDYAGCRVTVTKDATLIGVFLGSDLGHPEYYRYIETFDLYDVDRKTISSTLADNVDLVGHIVTFNTIGEKKSVHCVALTKDGKDAGCLPADSDEEEIRFDSRKEASAFALYLKNASKLCQKSLDKIDLSAGFTDGIPAK